MTNVSVTNPTEERLIQAFTAMIAKGKLTALFKVITEYLPTTSAAMAVDPAIELFLKALNNSTSKCCQAPIKAYSSNNLGVDTYHILIKCSQCGRIKSLNSPKPKYWILDLREKMHMTIEEVAAATGLHPRTIRKAEQHCAMIEATPVRILSRFYNVPIDSIRLEPYQETDLKGAVSHDIRTPCTHMV